MTYVWRIPNSTKASRACPTHAFRLVEGFYVVACGYTAVRFSPVELRRMAPAGETRCRNCVHATGVDRHE